MPGTLYINSFNPHNNPMRQMWLLASFLQIRKSRHMEITQFAPIMKPVSNETGTETSGHWPRATLLIAAWIRNYASFATRKLDLEKLKDS